nr:fumarylacetoacetate hydrolase family protein [Sphingomonas sp. Y57]
MRLQSFERGGRQGWGIVEKDAVRDMTDILPGIGSIKALLERDALDAAHAAAASAPLVEAALLRPLPVIPDPAKILCCGLNYHEHRIETHNPEVAHPTLFVRFADAQIGHKAAIERPPETRMLDYEAELAVVIGRPGRRIARDAALEHVAGYACYNDVSVRDWQKHTTQMTPGKNFPTTGPFGPWLVTRDEIADLAPLRIQCRLNGQVMQDARLGDMIFDVPRLIEYISTFTPLSPGDVILTGTPGGVGVRRDPQVFLQPGAEVEVEIEGVGLLANPVVQG